MRTPREESRGGHLVGLEAERTHFPVFGGEICSFLVFSAGASSDCGQEEIASEVG